MTAPYEEAYARGFRDAQEKARLEGRFVIVDSPELAALRARIDELEAVNERIKAVAATYLKDSLDNFHRANAAEAKLATATEALKAFEEFDNLPVAAKRPDVFEIKVRRKLLAAIRALKSTNQT